MRSRSGCIAGGILFFAAAQAFAGGLFLTPGARANGYGGAFEGVADDLSAIYWNPAGLTQLKDGRGVKIGANAVLNRATSNRSLNNVPVANAASINPMNGDFPFPALYPTEPSEFQNKEFKASAVLPFAAAYARSHEITFAAGFYAIGGGGGGWEKSNIAAGTDLVQAKATGQYGFTVANISAARTVNENLSFGAGIDMITMFDKQEIEKIYTRGAGSPLPVDYRLNRETEASGSGIQVNAGALYRFSPVLRGGLVFRSGTTLKLAGKAKYQQAGLPDFSFESDYDKYYAYPMTYGGGVSYDFSPKLTLAFGVEQNKYSMVRSKTTYKNELSAPLPVFNNENTDLRWKDTTQFKLGAEYRHNETWSFYGGMQNDPSPSPKDTITLIDLNQYDVIQAGLGAGYTRGSLTAAIEYGHIFGESITRGGTNYQDAGESLHLELGWAF